jgi:hypothetical protein
MLLNSNHIEPYFQKTNFHAQTIDESGHPLFSFHPEQTIYEQVTKRFSFPNNKQHENPKSNNKNSSVLSISISQQYISQRSRVLELK